MTFITQASMQAAREWFADNAQACIEEAQNGTVRVNDLDGYIAWRNEQARAALAGENDYSFTFRQRALFIQTGECPAFLPKY